MYMAKTNFSKVEEALIAGLTKMKMRQLLELADKAQADTGAQAETDAILIPEARRMVIAALRQDLKALKRKDTKVYSKLGLQKEGLQKLLDNPASLTPEDWQKIKEIHQKVGEYKKDLLQQLPEVTDDQLVDSERKKHINKRYNINEKWLPLH